MSTWVNVPRYHLVQRVNYVVLPWAVLAFAFAADLVILALIPAGHSSDRYVGGLAAIFVMLFLLGLQTVARSLPFGLALGLSRASYYLGTVGLAVALSAIYGLILAIGQVIERATGGWGIKMGFFRVPYVLQGPWYLTWLTSFVGLALLFVYGMWFGLVYRRWSLVGLVVFIAGQVSLVLAGAIVATTANAWHNVGHFFTALSAAGLTGLLAAFAAVLVAGGLATIRRMSV
jgi:hypothetical protein